MDLRNYVESNNFFIHFLKIILVTIMLFYKSGRINFKIYEFQFFRIDLKNEEAHFPIKRKKKKKVIQ